MNTVLNSRCVVTVGKAIITVVDNLNTITGYNLWQVMPFITKRIFNFKSGEDFDELHNKLQERKIKIQSTLNVVNFKSLKFSDQQKAINDIIDLIDNARQLLQSLQNANPAFSEKVGCVLIPKISERGQVIGNELKKRQDPCFSDGICDLVTDMRKDFAWALYMIDDDLPKFLDGIIEKLQQLDQVGVILLSNYKTTKLQNYKTTKLQNYKTTNVYILQQLEFYENQLPPYKSWQINNEQFPSDDEKQLKIQELLRELTLKYSTNADSMKQVISLYLGIKYPNLKFSKKVDNILSYINILNNTMEYTELADKRYNLLLQDKYRHLIEHIVKVQCLLQKLNEACELAVNNCFKIATCRYGTTMEG